MKEPSRRNRKLAVEYLISKIELSDPDILYHNWELKVLLDYSEVGEVSVFKWCFEEILLLDSKYLAFQLNWLNSKIPQNLLRHYSSDKFVDWLAIDKKIYELHCEVLSYRLSFNSNAYISQYVVNGRGSVGIKAIVNLVSVGQFEQNIWPDSLINLASLIATIDNASIRLLLENLNAGRIEAVIRIREALENRSEVLKLDRVIEELSNNPFFESEGVLYTKILRKKGLTISNNNFDALLSVSAVCYYYACENFLKDTLTAYTIVQLGGPLPKLPILDYDRFTNRQILKAIQISTSGTNFNNPRLYLIGSFDKRITIYTEQVRSIRICRALIETGIAEESEEIGVVGGGIAGITMALGLVQKGFSVSLFEKESKILNVQEKASHRFVHPNIFSWPEVGSDWVYSGFPISALDWSADTADRVAGVLVDKVNKYVKEHGKLNVFTNSRVTNLKSEKNGKISVYINGDDSKKCTFGSLIYSIGFGSDKSDFVDSYGYWEPDNLLALNDSITLVSGRGDGAFIDALRVTLCDFRHQNLINQFAENIDLRELGLKIMLLDDQSRSHALKGTQYSLYENCKKIEITSELLALFKSRVIKSSKTLILHRNEDPFKADTAIINRAALLILEKLGVIFFTKGELISVLKKSDALYEVVYRNEKDIEINKNFNKVIARHGPNIRDHISSNIESELVTSASKLGGIIAELGMTNKLDFNTDSFFFS